MTSLKLRVGSFAAICLLIASSQSVYAEQRSVTLIISLGNRLKIAKDTPRLPDEVYARSKQASINGGPVALCEGDNYKPPCIIIFNEQIRCELIYCFDGAGNWENRIRSVKFLPQTQSSGG